MADALYSQLVVRTVPVSSTATAEAVKLTENIFRAVNIALVNELKVVYDAMGIDVWEVIEAAKTKPFGFMPFYPGPGLGGHCIPIDPFYLTWKAREYDITTRFIELAGEINTRMPLLRGRAGWPRRLIAGRAGGSTGRGSCCSGMAYKKNVDDHPRKPVAEAHRPDRTARSRVDYHDAFIAEIPLTREYPALAGRQSVNLEAALLASYDAVLIATDHDQIDYRLVVDRARLVVDTRNACGRAGSALTRVVKA